MPRPSPRDGAIKLVRVHLQSRGAPRLQMTLVLVLTAALGFLASFGMLRLGITTMALRYPAAVIVAYASFLLLLRLWLAWYRRDRTAASELDLSGLDLPGVSHAPRPEFGGGGGFGGGGAGRSWADGGASGEHRPVSIIARKGSASAGDAKGDGWGFDLGDGAILLVPILAALAAVLASSYVIYAAPSLLAELLVDSLLVTALYRRLRGVEHRYWVGSALRRTWVPALLTAIVFSTAGYLMQRKYPQAPSIGPFWQAATHR